MPAVPAHTAPDQCPGALRMFAASDGLIARVRLAGSPLTVAQARAIGAMADQLGDGQVLFTTRANVQLRGLTDAGAAAFVDRVREIGLLPSDTHERARNIVVSPLGTAAPLEALARALDQALCAEPALATLSGRWLIGLDDGSGDIASLPLDVTAQVQGSRVVLALGRHHDETVWDVGPAADPQSVARLLADVCAAWVAVRDARPDTPWNVDDLDHVGWDALRDKVSRLLPRATAQVRRRSTEPRLAGVVREESVPGGSRTSGAGPGTVTLVLKAPLAAISAAGWLAACDVAAEAAGTLAVTPWHTTVIAGVAADVASAALADLARVGWVVDPADPWLRVHACTGRPACAKSRADVQLRAREIVGDLAADASTAHQPPAGHRLPLMISGCARQCGHPATPHLAVVASSDDSFAVRVHDGSHDTQRGLEHGTLSAAQVRSMARGEGST
ncbi:hypothetical protein MM440_13170 [Arsenicicoccus piscis]|uniref:Precorrin-3B synthase n=1 Tax=Arsenicicoccus piscis TaxID=673954 RepID=A0ABQ6HNV9_9MICO|nr:hypothetical protein [Arsenicicoccus piscis]MCH8628686.1 hypothetical protein [Arsenicicoccus piscis]GMA19379.1 precorrin-3B synthase [Arsenicicoccus piscis]